MAKQTGSEYREKNRIRLQRFYERQAASGKRRISALISDTTHGHLMAEKDKTGMSISEIIERALSQRYDPQEMTRFNESSVGYDGIPDVDDVSGDFLAAYGGPDPADTQETGATDQAEDTHGQGDDVEDIELDITLVNPEQDQAGDTQDPDQGKETDVDTVTDDTALVDQADDDLGDQIPDCAGKTITIEERDRILVQVMELLPGRNNAQARVTLLNRKGIPVSLKPGQYGGEWDRKKFTDNLGAAKKRLGVK